MHFSTDLTIFFLAAYFIASLQVYFLDWFFARVEGRKFDSNAEAGLTLSACGIVFFVSICLIEWWILGADK